MIDHDLEREELTVLPSRLETITIANSPVNQSSTVSAGNESGVGQIIDGELGDRFNGLFGYF